MDDQEPSTSKKRKSLELEDESKPMCKYGRDCYRKNPVHFQEFRHPGKLFHGKQYCMLVAVRLLSLSPRFFMSLSSTFLLVPYFRGLVPRGAYRFLKFLVGRIIEQGRLSKLMKI